MIQIFDGRRYARRSAKLAAIIRRDALLALVYPFAFVLRWLSLPVSISGAYFVSQLIGHGRHFGTGSGARAYFSYVAINLAFVSLNATALQAVATAMRYDQLFGTLEPIIAGDTDPALFAAATMIWPLGIAAAQVAVAIGFASVVFGLDLQTINFLSLSLFLLLGVGAMAAIGLLSAAAVIAFKQVPPTGHLVGGAASLLAGTIFPVALLPPTLQVISWLLPLTHTLAGIRGAFAGKNAVQLASDATWLAVSLLVLLPTAVLAVRAAVNGARADGTLSQY